MAKKERRTYTPEFRAEAVALVEREGVTQSQVARDIGISQSLLSKWVQNAKVAALPGALTLVEREEMRRLKRENAILRQERDILKKAAVDPSRQCNTPANLTAGHRNPRTFRGRSFKRVARTSRSR